MGAIMRFDRKMAEVRRGVEALGRTFHSFFNRVGGHRRVEIITQRCKLCGAAVELRYTETEETTAASIHEALMRTYDQHECARLSSELYWTNEGLDELYGRIEA